MRTQARRMSSGATRTRELESRLVERLYESFSTIRLVKGFAREPHELGRFSGAATDAMDARLQLSGRESMYGFLINTITVAGGLAVMGVGGLHVLDGTIRPGTLLVVMAYLGYVSGPMTAMRDHQRIESSRRWPVRGAYARRWRCPANGTGQKLSSATASAGPSRSSTSASGTRHRVPRCATCRSPSDPVRWWRSSVRPAPARQPS